MKVRLIRDGAGFGIKPCRLCGRNILWALTDRGRRMPMDVDVVPGAIWVVSWDDEAECPRVTHANNVPRGTPVDLRWQTHWASCERLKKSEKSKQSNGQRGVQLSLLDGGKGGGR